MRVLRGRVELLRYGIHRHFRLQENGRKVIETWLPASSRVGLISESFHDFIFFSRCRHLRAGKKPTAGKTSPPFPLQAWVLSRILGSVGTPEQQGNNSRFFFFSFIFQTLVLSLPLHLITIHPCLPLNPTILRQKPSLRHIRRRRFSSIKMRNKQCKSSLSILFQYFQTPSPVVLSLPMHDFHPKTDVPEPTASLHAGPMFLTRAFLLPALKPAKA